MHFERDVWQRYTQVHSLAKKEVRSAEKTGTEVYPEELKYVLDRRSIAEKIDLGILEIPVKRIVGTAVLMRRICILRVFFHWHLQTVPLRKRGVSCIWII